MEKDWERGKCAVANGLRWDPEANPMAKSAMQGIPPQVPSAFLFGNRVGAKRFPNGNPLGTSFSMRSHWERRTGAKVLAARTPQ